MDIRKIGVFDSGIGGLTALSDLIEKFPNEDFLYLADTLNCPYGTKTKEEIENIVKKNIDYLVNQDVKMIIIACNTATANSYGIIKNIPIIRIIEPTVNVANASIGKLLILATNYTIDSGSYKVGLQKEAYFERCSEFVEIVEKGLMKTKQSFDVVNHKLSKYNGKVDNVVLGCTHFGLLVDEIKESLGEINIIDSSLVLSGVVREELNKNNSNSDNKVGRVDIITTDEASMLKIDWFDKKITSIKKVNI